MPLLTVRLTDEEYAALKALAAGSSMAELIRGWIAVGSIPHMPGSAAILAAVADQEARFGASRPAPKPTTRDPGRKRR